LCSINFNDISDSQHHPGAVRPVHFVQFKNLPFSVDDVERTIYSCAVCTDFEPRFFKTSTGKLIKVTCPFERLF
ncbi:uncharacterized protein DEA37_0000435, partial [Paragonimus westermani]